MQLKKRGLELYSHRLIIASFIDEVTRTDIKLLPHVVAKHQYTDTHQTITLRQFNHIT
jgi:hypothetical protein